ncbi:succinylglutamate desuccinylase/aspartoacylase family protein [Brevibacillus sp. B_LB10_24]|uniref:succinylglutamate desuccinylase/aspartoacylase family protein n=1 Tax=Brevibacillus sp. B_LB10_24 TaxID=3380645 RepID=UPI0038B7DD8E
MREITFEPTSVTSYTVYEFGEGDGPGVSITAAVHGDEQTAVHASFLLVKAIESRNVRGRVKIIPVCNPAAFRNRTRWSPFDGLDLNRIFPGSAEGSPTEQLAQSLWQQTRGFGHMIDLHCCGVGGSTYTLALYEEYPHLRKAAEALGIPVVVQSGGTSGQLFVESCRTGQDALIIELPGGQPGGTIDLQAAEDCCQAVLRYLIHLGVLEGEASRPPVRFYGKISTLCAPRPGLFLPRAKPGSHCVQGEVLGTLEEAPVTAPFDGVITTLRQASYCFAGERLAGVAPLEKN